MRQWRTIGAWLLGASFWAVGCGQELVLPTRGQTGGGAAEAGPADGVTGVGGDPADGQTKRLPLLDDSGYLLGGAAGHADEERRCVSCAGSSARGGTSPGGRGPGGAAASGAVAAEGGGGGAAGAPGEPEPPPVLLFSEYVEGKGDLKALEIYALEGGSLEGCDVLTYFNGSQSPKRIALQGKLARGELLVVCTEQLATQEPSACDTVAYLAFNGDDAVALSCAGVMLDVIGEIGVDPGDSWGAGATLDHVLQRRCSVTAGRLPTQPFEIDQEWMITPPKDPEEPFSDLGRRSCEDAAPDSHPEE